MSARATSHKKHLLINSKYSPTGDSSSQDSGTSPPPPPPLLPPPPSQDMSLFDFEGSTNYFKSFDIRDDESFSDEGENVWELPPTKTAQGFDFSLTQILNNSSPKDIRRTEDSVIKGKEQISRSQSVDSIPSINSKGICNENYLAIPERMMDDVADSAVVDVTLWHDEEEKLDAMFDLVKELEELIVGQGVEITDNPCDKEEEDTIPDVFALNETATSVNVAKQTDAKNQDVDSALAWSALSFLLGSPAPASVTKKSSRKGNAKLWDFGVGAEDEDIPNLPSAGDTVEWDVSPSFPAQTNNEEEGIIAPPVIFKVNSFLQAKKENSGVDLSDTFTTSSLLSDDTFLSRDVSNPETRVALVMPGDEEEEDTIPDVFALSETATTLNVAKQTDAKNQDVDSALAWSALSFLLGSPAPASVTKKSSRKGNAKLWDFNAETEDEDIPNLPSAGDRRG